MIHITNSSFFNHLHLMSVLMKFLQRIKKSFYNNEAKQLLFNKWKAKIMNIFIWWNEISNIFNQMYEFDFIHLYRRQMSLFLLCVINAKQKWLIHHYIIKGLKCWHNIWKQINAKKASITILKKNSLSNHWSKVLKIKLNFL